MSNTNKDLVFPSIQDADLVIDGSPEGRMKAPPGLEVTDRISGDHYIKKSERNLSTGWQILGLGVIGPQVNPIYTGAAPPAAPAYPEVGAIFIPDSNQDPQNWLRWDVLTKAWL